MFGGLVKAQERVSLFSGGELVRARQPCWPSVHVKLEGIVFRTISCSDSRQTNSGEYRLSKVTPSLCIPICLTDLTRNRSYDTFISAAEWLGGHSYKYTSMLYLIGTIPGSR
jgi:hypothetical protein